MGFSQQEYWSGLPFPPLGDLPHPGKEPSVSCVSCIADGFFTAEPPEEPLNVILNSHMRLMAMILGQCKDMFPFFDFSVY